MPDTSATKPNVENTIPVLGVSDMRRSALFYTETLGFELNWGGGEDDALSTVSKDGHSIMLMANGQTGSWVWIGLEDNALMELYMERGVKIVQKPKNRSWAYEMKIADPDGNVLWLGTGTRQDLPVED